MTSQTKRAVLSDDQYNNRSIPYPARNVKHRAAIRAANRPLPHPCRIMSYTRLYDCIGAVALSLFAAAAIVASIAAVVIG